MNVKAIIFDFDGTLMDSEAAVLTALKRTLADFAVPIPEGTPLRQLSCHRIEDIVAPMGIADADRQRAFVAAYNDIYRQVFADEARLFRGVRRTLARLQNRGVRMAVATNEVSENLACFLPQLSLVDFFETTICADEVTRSKPHPEMALTVMGRMGMEAAHTLMVGDSFLDIEMGRRSGCRTCGICHDARHREQLAEHAPDWIVDNLEAVAALIEGRRVCTINEKEY